MTKVQKTKNYWIETKVNEKSMLKTLYTRREKTERRKRRRREEEMRERETSFSTGKRELYSKQQTPGQRV